MSIRGEKTRTALKEALIACMKEKPVRDMTAADISGRAGVDRATFYRYYGSVDGIVAELERDQLEEFRKLMETGDIFGEELIGVILDQIEKGREINRTAMIRYFSEDFTGELAEIAKKYAFDQWQKKMPQATREEVGLALTTAVATAFQVVAQSGSDFSRETLARYIGNMIGGITLMYGDPAASGRAKTVQDLADRYASRYEAVMLADLNTGLYRTLSKKDGVMTDAGSVPFADAVLKNVLRYVHPSDRRKLADGAGDFDRIRRELAVGGSEDIEYRVDRGGAYVWYRITLNRVSRDELLIALGCCDDEVVTRIVNSRLLSRYEAVYLIDLKHNEVRPVKASGISAAGAFTERRDFTRTVLQFAETVDPRYREDWVRFSDPDYLRQYMAEQDTREYVYLLPGVEKTLRRLIIDVEERADGEASVLLFSFMSVDESSAKAMLLQAEVNEKQSRLQETLTFTNFFLDTYVSAYYVNLSDRSWKVYKRTAELDEQYPIVNDYFESLRDYILRGVHPDDRQMVLAAADPDRMRGALREKPEYSLIFRDITGKETRTYRMQVIRGAEADHAAFGFIDISDETRAQMERLSAAEEAQKLIDNIAARYSVAFTVNMANGDFNLLKLERAISHKFERFSTFEEAKASLLDILHDTDKRRMMEELSFGTVREKLKERKSYTVEYRTCIGGSSKWHEMNVTAVDRDQVAMGFAEKDVEITKRRLEDMRYDEYLALFTVDLDTEMIKPLKTSAYFETVEAGQAVPYSYGMKRFAAVYEGEAKDFFTQIADIENVRKEFAKDNKRTYSYRSAMLGENKWIDVVSYVILRHEDGTPAMITLGFSMVDALATARKELLSRLTENMQMIGGLAGGYDALLYINIDEDVSSIYALNEERYPGAREHYTREKDVYGSVRSFGQSAYVHPDDQALFADFGPGMIREKLKDTKKYSLRFRLDTGNGYRWNEMDLIKYENAEEQANAVAVGFADRDADIRSEQAINSTFDVLGQDLTGGQAIDRILSIAGDFYGADRCYVFEYAKRTGTIDNTYEWCAPGIEPMIGRLQDVPLDAVEGWNREFERQGAFYMDALDSEHNTAETVAILEMQGIQSLVAAPILNGGEIAGFIGVDNPAKAKRNISILEKASAVIYSEILKRDENSEEHVTLGKLADTFLSVYYVDLETDYMRTWKIDEQYQEAYGNTRRYSESMGGYVRENIPENERERCARMTSPEYIHEQFRTKDRYSIDMTDIMLGCDRSVVFDYIKVSPDGNRLVICARDVTDTLAREKEQQKQLQEALEAADTANRSKTDFLFSMSHDIRTPMNAITGFTNMAVKHIGDREKVLDCLGKTQKAGMMLLSLINSILEVSRIESGHATLDEQPGDVYYSFANIESTMNEMAESRDIALSFSFGEIAHRYVYADFSRCMRVFVNVISNAIKYTREGGYVRVRCEEAGPAGDGRIFYRYTVEDNGIGMSEEFQRHVFDQFARESTATVSGIQGTGLGMTVCKSFVELMGGTVTVKSRQGVGTTFTVLLPFRLQEGETFVDPETGEVVSADVKPEPAEETDFSGKNVLLVEDNELNREIAIEILEEEGFLVEDADDGTAAVAAMKEKGPDYFDFILMDIQMPKMNGYEATKAIRAMYPDRHIPIIALSANAFAEDKAASVAAGMDDHVAKPINIPELLSAIARYLPRGR